MTTETNHVPPVEEQQDAILNSPPMRNLIPAGGRIQSIIPQNVDETLRMSRLLAGSGDMVPEAFRGKPDAIAAAILRGLDVGLAPMQALQSIAVIKGKTMLWGDGVKALLLKHGFVVETGTEGTGNEMFGWARVTRPDTGQIIERTFSWNDAKRANLLTKDTYQAYPQRMFMARALAWAARDGAADVLMGLAVVEEETHGLPGMKVVGGTSMGAEPTGLAAVVAARAAAKAQAQAEVEDADVVTADEEANPPVEEVRDGALDD
jgi:hypothetical protein